MQDAGIISYEVYENAKNYLGHAQVTLPDVVRKTLALNGAGISGDVNMPVPRYEAMTVKIDFTDNPESAYVISTPGVHKIDIRAAHQYFDEVGGVAKVAAYKHVMELMPSGKTGGTLAPAAAQGTAVDFSCLSIKTYIDGKLVRHIDPLRNIDIDASGKNNLAEINAALGK